VAAGTLVIAGGTALDGGWTVTCEGTTDWTSGTLYLGYNPGSTSAGGSNTFVNAKGASFDDQNAAGYAIDLNSGTRVFSDAAGLFDKTAASGTGRTTVSTAFDNSATVAVGAGIVGGFAEAALLKPGVQRRLAAADPEFTSFPPTISGLPRPIAEPIYPALPI
jgi:hypothetical protein